MNIYTCVDRTPYTYLIGWKAHNKWYYGVRFAKGCHPNDLWMSYFTSSTHVKTMIAEFGNPDVIQIRKTFSSKESAIEWEYKVLTRMKVIHTLNWINKTTNKSIAPFDCSKHTKGKTYEEIYGEERAIQLKAKRSTSNKTRVLLPWEERKTKEHGNLGRKDSQQVKIKKADQATQIWENVEYRIKMSQVKGTDFIQINICPTCGKYKPANKVYCNRICRDNRAR